MATEGKDFPWDERFTSFKTMLDLSANNLKIAFHTDRKALLVPLMKRAELVMADYEEWIAQALARLSPAAKAIAVAQAKTTEAKQQIEALTVDVVSAPITVAKLAEAKTSLKEVPPVRFDLARQVRVFEPYLQYVELSLSGAAIQRHRMAIPLSIQKLGGSKDLYPPTRNSGEAFFFSFIVKIPISPACAGSYKIAWISTYPTVQIRRTTSVGAIWVFAVI